MEWRVQGPRPLPAGWLALCKPRRQIAQASSEVGGEDAGGNLTCVALKQPAEVVRGTHEPPTVLTDLA
jgi:hypothetical protein